MSPEHLRVGPLETAQSQASAAASVTSVFPEQRKVSGSEPQIVLADVVQFHETDAARLGEGRAGAVELVVVVGTVVAGTCCLAAVDVVARRAGKEVATEGAVLAGAEVVVVSAGTDVVGAGAVASVVTD